MKNVSNDETTISVLKLIYKRLCTITLTYCQIKLFCSKWNIVHLNSDILQGSSDKPEWTGENFNAISWLILTVNNTSYIFLVHISFIKLYAVIVIENAKWFLTIVITQLSNSIYFIWPYVNCKPHTSPQRSASCFPTITTSTLEAIKM